MRGYNILLEWKGVKLNGLPRYIGKDVKFDNYKKITLGDRVVISNECFLLTHDYSYTTALIAINDVPKSDIAMEQCITIGDNVFIGKRSIIMPNCTIENNVIVGAGSVVRGHIPEDSIVIGNPCQVIGSTKEKAYKWKKNIDKANLRQD